MKFYRHATSSLCFSIGLGAAAAAVFPACSSDAPRVVEEEPEASLGTVQLALTTEAASGAVYRLRNAQFDVFRLGDAGGGGVIIDPPLPPRPVPLPGPFEPTPGGEPDDASSEGSASSGFGGAPSAGDRSSGTPAGSGAGPSTGGGMSMGGAPAGSGGFGSGGAPSGGSGGAGGAGMAGSASGGSGSGPFDPFFSTTLFSESDPFGETLEADLPTGSYEISLFGGWFLERVQNGVVEPVEARLVSSPFQFFDIRANGETFVSYRFETNGEVIEFGEGRLIVTIDVDEVSGGGGDGDRRSVIEHSELGLSAFSLRGTLDAALRNSGAAAGGATALDAYHAIIDSYARASQGREPSAPHCDDETTNGSASLNGFPLQCGRLEAQQFDNLDSWFPLAAVNRLDLAPRDGSNCGQQRVIFANGSPIGNGRMFVIVEAVVPNPEPECGVSACRPIAEFWDSLSRVDDPILRSELLAQAFLFEGVGPFGPFMNSDNLGPNGGQVRTNNFNDFIWTLREFHFQSAPEVLPVPRPVAEAPNGELWNDLSALAVGPACRESILDAMSGLVGNNLASMTFPVAEACRDAESPNDFFRHDYQSHLGSGSGEFIAQMDERLLGTGLSAFDVAARARFAGSCMGCHQEASGSFLGNGLSAPFQRDFVHVSEFEREPCADGVCFGLSEALSDIFLPHRLEVQSEFLGQPGECGSDGGEPLPPPGFPDPGEPAPIPDLERGPGLNLSLPVLTLGGQVASPHGH